jgi:Fic family protein
MRDPNWDLIDGEAAHEIEYLNYANQINVIEALFKLLVHQYPVTDGNGCSAYPNAQALRELHRVGTLFLLAHPGEFRDTEVNVQTVNGVVVYQPPSAAEVPGHIDEMIADIDEMWRDATPMHIAAYVLWRINWIHPFKNGNGRTARAFAYTCLCLKFGFMLPGFPTVIDLITTTRQEYNALLREADEIFLKQNEPDVSNVAAYIERLLIQQLSSIPEGQI